MHQIWLNVMMTLDAFAGVRDSESRSINPGARLRCMLAESNLRVLLTVAEACLLPVGGHDEVKPLQHFG